MKDQQSQKHIKIKVDIGIGRQKIQGQDWSKNDTKFGPFRQDGKMEELLNFSYHLLQDTLFETVFSIIVEYTATMANATDGKNAENNWR